MYNLNLCLPSFSMNISRVHLDYFLSYRYHTENYVLISRGRHVF